MRSYCHKQGSPESLYHLPRNQIHPDHSLQDSTCIEEYDQVFVEVYKQVAMEYYMHTAMEQHMHVAVELHTL